MRTKQIVKACAAHVAPVYLDPRETVAKACRLIAEAAAKGADIIAFPEVFIPGFPLWPAVLPPYRNHDLFSRYVAASVRVPGPEVFEICQAAREHGIFVSMGVSESTDASVGCIWNSNLLIGSDGAILTHHRKLVPTFYEKLIWANGDAVGLRVEETPIGRLGMLICGENTNPLARFALIAAGEQIHISSYPPVWPTHEPGAGAAFDLASAIRIRAGAHSFEAKAFNIVASSVLDEDALAELPSLDAHATDILRHSPRAVSMIINPQGAVIAETASTADELLLAEIDLSECVVPKQFHDLAGYYNRFDIFRLSVDRTPREPIGFTDGTEPRAYSFDALHAQYSM
jgi:nitrilase